MPFEPKLDDRTRLPSHRAPEFQAGEAIHPDQFHLACHEPSRAARFTSPVSRLMRPHVTMLPTPTIEPQFVLRPNSVDPEGPTRPEGRIAADVS
jgi:hypothetical protein